VTSRLAPSSDARAEARRYLLRNVVSNGAFVVLPSLVSLWFVPYAIRHLGVAVYGLIALATSVTNFFGVLTGSFNSAASRYLTMELARGDNAAANRTFNSALSGGALVAAAILPISLALVFAAPRLFRIPSGQEIAFRWLFAATAGGFLVTALGSAFQVSSFARSRFDLQNSVGVASLLLNRGVVVALFAALTPSLWHVGTGILAGVLVSLVGSIVIWRHLTPQLHIRPWTSSRSLVVDMIGMGSWLTLGQVGFMAHVGTDIVVANLILGPLAAGTYAPLLQLSVLTRSMASTMVRVITPVAVAGYACDGMAGTLAVTRRAMNILGLLMALPIGLLCGLAKPFLALWLGPSFQGVATVLSIMIFPLCVNLAVAPIGEAAIALNKVRWPSTITLITGLIQIALALALAKWSGWGISGIAVAGALALTLNRAVFMPAYGAAIMKTRWLALLLPLIPGIVGAVVLGALAYGISQVWAIRTWPGLISLVTLLSGLYGVVVYSLVLQPGDRALARNLLRRQALVR